jgi:hypothetical protein
MNRISVNIMPPNRIFRIPSFWICIQTETSLWLSRTANSIQDSEKMIINKIKNIYAFTDDTQYVIHNLHTYWYLQLHL